MHLLACLYLSPAWLTLLGSCYQALYAEVMADFLELAEDCSRTDLQKYMEGIHR